MLTTCVGIRGWLTLKAQPWSQNGRSKLCVLQGKCFSRQQGVLMQAVAYNMAPTPRTARRHAADGGRLAAHLAQGSELGCAWRDALGGLAADIEILWAGAREPGSAAHAAAEGAASPRRADARCSDSEGEVPGPMPALERFAPPVLSPRSAVKQQVRTPGSGRPTPGLGPTPPCGRALEPSASAVRRVRCAPQLPSKVAGRESVFNDCA